MKKIMLILLAFLLCGCSLTFDPAGKLAQKRTVPTSTPAIAQVKRLVASPTTETACKVTGDLNLRAAPNADAKVIDWLLSGQPVVATGGESGGWRPVRNWAGASGWVNARWLECGK